MRIQTSFPLLFCILLQTTLFAQSGYVTVKTAPEKAVTVFREGKAALQANDVAGAIRKYERALEIAPLFIDAMIYLGGAHYESKHWAEAEKAFESAIYVVPDYEPRVYYTLAKAEWEQDKFEESAGHAATFLRSDPTNPSARSDAEALQRNAQFAVEAVKHPISFQPINLGDSVNTAGDEYFPVLTADGMSMVFTRRDGGADENFYASHPQVADRSKWGTSQPLEGINTPLNEGAEAISSDGSWLVFTACFRKNDGSQGGCDLYWSQNRGEGWSKPTPFSNVINTVGWESQPTLSADGKTIIFASDRKGGYGSIDLWETTRQPNGKWSDPQNLGPAVNSKGDDQLPFLHPDGQTLYFTSNGWPGMGDDDLFLCRKSSTGGGWSTPKNLGYPLNTKGKEINLVTSLDGKTAYFSAIRPEGKGKLDIYAFELAPSLRPQPVTYLKAKVKDAATGYPLVAKVQLTDLKTGKPVQAANTQKDGTFLVCLPAGIDYALSVSKDKYLFHSEHFNLTETATFDQPFTLKIALQPIAEGTASPTAAPVVLNNVFFATGSAELQPSSTAELDQLAALLQQNMTLRIQIDGHTDNVGDAASNQRLSEQRAQAVLQYLVSKGIATERLRAKGFGMSQPIGPNDTEEGRKRNRRTAFEVWTL